MVILLAIVLLMPVAASADTLDEDALRQLLAPAEAAHARRNTRAKVSGGVTVPAKPGPGVAEPPPEPRRPPAHRMRRHRSQNGQRRPAARIDSRRATPGDEIPHPSPTPPTFPRQARARRHRSPTADADGPGYLYPAAAARYRIDHAVAGVSQKTRRFGITLGTWFRAHIERRITNADNGQVEVTLEEDVPGKPRRSRPGRCCSGKNRSTRVAASGYFAVSGDYPGGG